MRPFRWRFKCRNICIVILPDGIFTFTSCVTGEVKGKDQEKCFFLNNINKLLDKDIGKLDQGKITNRHLSYIRLALIHSLILFILISCLFDRDRCLKHRDLYNRYRLQCIKAFIAAITITPISNSCQKGSMRGETMQVFFCINQISSRTAAFADDHSQLKQWTNTKLVQNS